MSHGRGHLNCCSGKRSSNKHCINCTAGSPKLTRFWSSSDRRAALRQRKFNWLNAKVSSRLRWAGAFSAPRPRRWRRPRWCSLSGAISASVALLRLSAFSSMSIHIEVDTHTERDDWRLESQPEFTATPRGIEASDENVRWGGFFRRAGASLIDFVMIILLFTLTGIMAYVGFKVGLAAHDRPISWSNAAPLMSFLTFAGMGLTTAYFVVFHGMEGKTIGKWLLGLRVVSTDQVALTYRQALLRWIGTVGFGLVSFGLSFLWVL